MIVDGCGGSKRRQDVEEPGQKSTEIEEGRTRQEGEGRQLRSLGEEGWRRIDRWLGSGTVMGGV